jgi:hypothetical protein
VTVRSGALRAVRRLAIAVALVVGAGVALAAPDVLAQGAGPESPEEVRQTADEVLARQEFQRPEPTVLERIRDWIGDRLSSLFDRLTGGGAGSVVGWVVLVAAVGALIWSLTRLSRSIRPDPVAPASVRIDQGRTPDAWREEAERLEADSAWKDALRCRYRALLGDLVRAGIIEDVPGRTTGEYRREVVAVRPTVSDAMGTATDLFEWAWYGDLPTGAGESDRFRIAAGAVVDGVGATGRVDAVVG